MVTAPCTAAASHPGPRGRCPSTSAVQRDLLEPTADLSVPCSKQPPFPPYSGQKPEPSTPPKCCVLGFSWSDVHPAPLAAAILTSGSCNTTGALEPRCLPTCWAHTTLCLQTWSSPHFPESLLKCHPPGTAFSDCSLLSTVLSLTPNMSHLQARFIY